MRPLVVQYVLPEVVPDEKPSRMRVPPGREESRNSGWLGSTPVSRTYTLRVGRETGVERGACRPERSAGRGQGASVC